MASDIIRVVLADDHTVVRAGLKAVLGAAKDIQVIGEVGNGRDAIAMVERMKPDVLVMDLSMEPIDGAEATKQLVAAGTTAKILILTMHSPDEALIPLLESGASGFRPRTRGRGAGGGTRRHLHPAVGRARTRGRLPETLGALRRALEVREAHRS
jgi:DNA-binding NarL/FixJ family response regulator